MKIVKTTAYILAMAILLVSLAGCNKAGKQVVAKIDGKDVTVDFFENALKRSNAMIQQTVGFDLSQLLDQEIDGKTGADILKEEAIKYFQQVYAAEKLAADYKISLSAEDKETIKKYKDDMINQYGGRSEFIKQLEAAGMSEEFLDFSMNSEYLLYMKLHGELFHIGKPLAPRQEDMVSVMLKDYVRAKHILIQATAEDADFNDKKAKAESVLARAKAGEDFDALITEFNEDPGVEENPDGYVFTKNQMAKEFEDAAYALNENEISGLVQTSYGFHILKKLPLTEAYITENIEKYSETFEQEAMNNKIAEISEQMKVEYLPLFDSIDVKKALGVEDAPAAGDDNAPIELQPADGSENAAGDNAAPPADNAAPPADNAAPPADNTQAPADNAQAPADNGIPAPVLAQ